MPDDLRNVWQNQPTEVRTMSAELMRYKAQQQYQRGRFQAQASIALGIALCALFAWSCARAQELITRIGWGLLSLWCLWFAYQVYRWIWPEELAENAPTGPSLEFYRRELERRTRFARHNWLRAGLPLCFLGLGLVVLPPLIRSPRLTPNALPFFTLLIAWFVAYLYQSSRNRRKLQREIEELRAFERQRE
jgi:hypothetical protein